MRNRDVACLKNVKWAMIDLQDIEDKLIWQRERLQNATQRISDMPRGGGVPKGLEGAVAAIVDLEARYTELLKRCNRELDMAERTLEKIKSRQARTFARQKYMLGRSDRAIRQDMGISRAVFARLRIAIEDVDSMDDVRWRDD